MTAQATAAGADNPDMAESPGQAIRRAPEDEALAHLLLEHATDGVVIIDPTGRLSAVTPGFERMLGRPKGSLAGTDGFALLHPDEREAAALSLAAMNERGNGAPRPVTFRIAHAAGSWLSAELLAAPGRLDDGRMIVTVRDVTAWIRAEEALRGAQELQAVVSTIAARFVDALPEEIDAAVSDALGELATYVDADRAQVTRFTDDLSVANGTHEWCAPGIASKLEALQGLRSTDFARAHAALRRGECIRIESVAALSPAWTGERELLEREGIRSVVGVPMAIAGNLAGLMALESQISERSWEDDTVRLLRVAADLIGSALARRDAQLASRTQAERFRALVQNSSDLIVVLDAEGNFLIPPMGRDVFGYDPSSLPGTSALDLLEPDDLERALGALTDVGDKPGKRVTIEVRARTVDGEWIPLELIAVNRLHDPLIRGIVLNVRDIRERLRVERELRESEERYRTLISNLPGAVFRCEPFPPYRDIFVSKAVQELTGYTAEQFLADTLTFGDLILPEHRDRTEGELAEAFRNRGPYVIEYPIRHRDGDVRWISERGQVSFGNDGTPLWLEGAMFDVSERRELERQLAHDARHDPLTGLPNRARLLEHLGGELERASRTQLTVAVLFIDLDRFKLVNDALGHVAGDELLVAFGRRLAGVLRASDVATRTGGDEFVVVLSDVGSPVEAEHVAHRIARTLGAPFEIRGREVFVTASIGIAVADELSDAAGLLRDADVAAYRAKERGRNRYEVFDEALRAATAAALETESALHRAVDEDQLLLRYQPVMDLRTGVAVGFEGLLRWDHPVHGLLGPDRFLDAAEASGLVVPIGRRVVQMACSVLASLPEHLGLAVNLSPRELAQPDLVGRVRQAMRDSGVAPGRLCLEITESALLEDADQALATLAELEHAGVRLAIDDFGTGYSSLNYLRRLPVDVVKIDRSFVAELGRGTAGDTIIAGVVGLALGLGLEVVAEGVEQAEQAARLLELGCTRAQGFHFSPAVPIDEALAFAAPAPSGPGPFARH